MQCPSLSKISWTLVNIACILAGLIQLGFIIEGFIKPSLLNTSVKEVNLHDLNFPIEMEICASPGFNETALEQMGYEPGIWNYFFGRSRFNSSIVGWAGHTANFEVWGSVEEVLNMAKNHKIHDIIVASSSWITLNSGKILQLSSEYFYPYARVTYPRNCFYLNLSFLNDMQQEWIDSVEIGFNTTKIEKVEVALYGKSLVANRDVYDNTFDNIGDKIHVRQPGYLTKFAVEISENSYLEEDKSKNCRNYPNPEYASYKECDDDYMRAICKSANLTPVWLAEDMKLVTKKAVIGTDNSGWQKIRLFFYLHLFLVDEVQKCVRLFLGTDASSCPRPCKTFQTKAKYIAGLRTGSDPTEMGVKMRFSSKVS